MGKLVPPIFIGGGPANQSINVISGSTANTFGPWASFGTLPYSISEIYIFIEASSGNTLVNIGIGPPGSQTIIIPQIAQVIGGNEGDPTTFFRCRMKLPAGTEVWAQTSSVNASSAGRVSLGVGFSESPSISMITPLGIDLSTSSLISQTSGATAGTYGAWVSLGTLAVPGRTLWYTGTRSLTSLMTFNIGVGPSGSQSILLGNIPSTLNNLIYELETDCPPGEYWMQVAGGSSATAIGGIWIAS